MVFLWTLDPLQKASSPNSSAADLVTHTAKLSRMSKTPIQIPQGYLDPRVESLPPIPPPDRDLSARLDGVVIPVWAGDVYLAKACCASIRRFMGDIPITLFVDGPATNTRQVQRIHGVSRIVLQDVASAEDARFCSGSSWSKLPLFWMSPYERFLCLDADTMVWGDVRVYAEFDRFDLIAAHHLHTRLKFQTPEQVERYVFDVGVVAKLEPALDWREKEFAVAGVFFARRGVFSEAHLMELARLDCWRNCEQGLLNYLRWRCLQQGAPRAGGHRFQIFPGENVYQIEDRFLARHHNRPTVIHWLGKKPKLGRPFQAANDYRKLFLTMIGQSEWVAARLLIEDVVVWLGRQNRSFAKQFQRETMEGWIA